MPETIAPGNDVNPSAPDEEARVGMYTCYCGGNISSVIECERVAKALGQMPNVVVSRTHMAMCSDAGQTQIEQDIKEKGVNRVVVGACSPFLHEQTFRGTVTRAGLNPYLRVLQNSGFDPRTAAREPLSRVSLASDVLVPVRVRCSNEPGCHFNN